MDCFFKYGFSRLGQQKENKKSTKTITEEDQGYNDAVKKRRKIEISEYDQEPNMDQEDMSSQST